MGFRGKQIATLTLVAATVALATSLVNLTSLARLAVAENRTRAELLAETLYHQASRVIRQHGRDDGIAEALASDASLASYAEGVVGYSPTIMYVAVTDLEERALVHSDPSLRGEILNRAPSLEEFADQGALPQLLALSRGHQILEVTVPFEVDTVPFGSVRVAISTLLLREELAGAITRNVALATGAVLVAFLASFYLANRLLAPIEMLRRELSRIDPGEGEPPLDLRNEADVSRVAEFFASMSRRLADEKSGRDSESGWRDSESGWLATMLGGLSDAVVVFNEEGQVLSLNRPAEKLLSPNREELSGRSLSSLLAPDHPVSQIVASALSRGESVGPTNATIEDEGKRTVYALSAQVLREGERVSGVMVSARDMDKLSRLGSHLSYSQKLAALGKLTSGVAHEIKNPLNAMVIHVALLREKFQRSAPEARPSLDTLEQEIRRLDSVIQGFLKFTRPEDLQLTSVSLPELIGEVVRLISAEARAAGIDVETRFSKDLLPIYGDRELLQQVLHNLARNALEAMPDGGKLELEANRRDESVEIVVRDTGVGIEPSRIDQIFDLYVTSKSKGSGIGLSVVYRIVQLHGGEITVESRKGEGACFTVRLPQMPV
jgi:PAS domain S-box-containing protein